MGKAESSKAKHPPSAFDRNYVKSVEEIRDVGGAKSIVGRSWKSLSGRIVVSSFP